METTSNTLTRISFCIIFPPKNHIEVTHPWGVPAMCSIAAVVGGVRVVGLVFGGVALGFDELDDEGEARGVGYHGFCRGDIPFAV